MSATLITIALDREAPDGSTPGGRILFSLSEPFTNGAVTYGTETITGWLSPTGALVAEDQQSPLELVANNDPASSPSGSFYNVVEQIDGSDSSVYAVVVPYDPTGGTVVLDSLTRLTV